MELDSLVVGAYHNLTQFKQWYEIIRNEKFVMDVFLVRFADVEGVKIGKKVATNLQAKQQQSMSKYIALKLHDKCFRLLTPQTGPQVKHQNLQQLGEGTKKPT